MSAVGSWLGRRRWAVGMWLVAAVSLSLLPACSYSEPNDSAPVSVAPSPTSVSAGPCVDAQESSPPQATTAPSPTPPPEPELLPQLPEDVDDSNWTWGPSRPTYTYCRPSGHATINSIVDDSQALDETGFFFLQRHGQDAQLRDITLSDGDSYRATIYFWNSVAENIPDGATQNAKVRLTLPKFVTNSADSRAEICADNTIPRCVWMTLALSTENDQTLQLSVRDESIAMHVGGNTYPISRGELDSSDGILLGCSGFTGVLDGSGSCKGSIQFDVDVHEPQSQLDVTTWVTSYDRKIRPGSTFRVSVTYTLPSDRAASPLNIGLLLPRGLTVPTKTLRLSAWDSASLSWGPWVDAEARYIESTGALWLEVPESLHGSDRLSLSATVMASIDSEFVCGGNWVEITGYAWDNGVTQTRPELVTIEPTC